MSPLLCPQVWASQFGRQPPPPPPQDVASAPEKKQKVDTGGSALDFIKQEYAEAYSAEAHQVVQAPPPGSAVTYAAAGMYGVAGLPGVAVMPSMPSAYERLLGESQRAAVAQSMYGAALYQPALAAPVKGIYGYPGLADSGQLSQSYLQQQQQLQLQQQLQQRKAGMALAWSTAPSPGKPIAAAQSAVSGIIPGYTAITDQWPEEYADKADGLAKVALQARAVRPDDGFGTTGQKTDYSSYGNAKSSEERQTSVSVASSGSGYYRSYGNNSYGDSSSTEASGGQAWKQDKRESAKGESDNWQDWGDQNRSGGFSRSGNNSQSWSGAGYGGGGRVKQEADDAGRRNEKPRKSRWEPQTSNDTTPPSERPGILGSYTGGQQGGGGGQDRRSDGRSWGRGSSDQGSNRSGGFGGQTVSSEWRAAPRDTDSRTDRRGSDRGFSSRGNFNDRSQSDRGRNDSRSFPDRTPVKEESSFQDRSRQFGLSRRDDNRSFQDRDKSGRGFGSSHDDGRSFGSEGGSRQYPNRDACRNGDQDSRYRDNPNQLTPPGDRFASRGDRPAQGGSNEYSQFQSRGDRPGAPSGDNKMDFRGRGGPPGDNKVDFRGRGALSGDSKMEFRGRGGPPADSRMDFQGQRERLGDVGKGDYQGRGPPSGNGFQGRGGQSGGQEDNRTRPGAADKNDSAVSSNRIGQDKSVSVSGQGDGEDKKVEVKMEDNKQSLLGSKPPPHDGPPPIKPHPMDGPPPGFGRGGFSPRGGRGGMRPPFGMPPGPPPPRPGMFRGPPPPGRGGPRFGGPPPPPRPGFGGPRGPGGGVHPLMGGPRGGFRPPGPGGPGGRGGRGGFGGPPRWQRPPRPPLMWVDWSVDNVEDDTRSVTGQVTGVYPIGHHPDMTLSQITDTVSFVESATWVFANIDCESFKMIQTF